MDPLSIAGLAIGGLSSLFSAGAGIEQSNRQARQTLIQADQQRTAIYKEASSVGQSTVDQALRQSRIYGIAQDIASSNATLASEKGNLQVNRQKDATDATLATQKNFFVGGNIDPTSGSPLMLAAAGAAQGESDAQIIRADTAQGVATQTWNAYSAAESNDYGFKSAKATIDGTYDSAITRAGGLTTSSGMTAANDRMAGVYGAATTLLNTAAKWGSSPGTRDTLAGAGRTIGSWFS